MYSMLSVKPAPGAGKRISTSRNAMWRVCMQGRPVLRAILLPFLVLPVLVLLATGQKGMAQPSYWTDSLKKNVSEAKNDREKFTALISLAQYYTGENNE